jgi:uncharacterized protein
MRKKFFLGFILLFLFCSKNYIENIREVETMVYSQEFESAVPQIRNLVIDAPDKDKLLYLMEAGVVLHSKKDFESSNKAFMEAEVISETLESSITKNTLSFFLSDNESNFLGENFERVLIKVYIALNYLNLNQMENAKRYFKKVEFELKEMKFDDAKYKQNIFARYLDAIASESLSSYNDARVQYKNLLELAPEHPEFLGDRYVLAMKEGDSNDIKKYQKGSTFLSSYNKDLQVIPYNTNLGELIVINQAGKAAVKQSRGKLMDDPEFSKGLRASVEGSLRSQSVAGLAIFAVILSFSFAENPIPIYTIRDDNSSKNAEILLNSKPISKTNILNNYTETAIKNFNDNYSKIITKNIASIATKITVVAMASIAIAQSSSQNDDDAAQLVKGVAGFVTGLVGGYAVSQTIKPDLRCWHTIPSNFQAKRIFLEEGEYELTLKSGAGKTETIKILIEKSKSTIVNFRTL